MPKSRLLSFKPAGCSHNELPERVIVFNMTKNLLIIALFPAALLAQQDKHNWQTEHLSGNVSYLKETVYLPDSLNPDSLVPADDNRLHLSSNYILEFNRDGNLVKRSYFTTQHTYQYSVYQYDRNNNCIRDNTFHVKDPTEEWEELWETSSEYNEANQLVRDSMIIRHKPHSKTSYSYDRYGRRMTDKTRYMNHGTGEYEDDRDFGFNYVLTENNVLREDSYYVAANDSIGMQEASLRDTLGRFVGYIVYGGGDTHTIAYAESSVYNEQGQVIETVYTEYGKPDQHIYSEYDRYGNLLRDTEIIDGEQVILQEYSYEFDDHHNWIVRRCNSRHGHSHVRKREILYFR
jgi:hypothetical protein